MNGAIEIRNEQWEVESSSSGGGAPFVYEQLSPVLTQDVVHNRGEYPSAVRVSELATGEEFWCETQDVDVNTLRLTFDESTTFRVSIS